MRIPGEQCKGKTKTGNRCTRLVTVWCSGEYCSIHKSQEPKEKECAEASISGKEAE